MPWRLIQFIVVFAIFLVFIIFNMGNRCDISFGFMVFSDVPVFITVFFSFFAGILCAIPFLLMSKSQRKNKATAKEEKQGKKPSKADRDAGTGSYGID